MTVLLHPGHDFSHVFLKKVGSRADELSLFVKDFGKTLPPNQKVLLGNGLNGLERYFFLRHLSSAGSP
jgi:hypothetical protein